MNIKSALVKSILEKWSSYEWTVQGLGFIRTKIANVGRIHVWDSGLAVPRVSTAHSHPWPFTSTIISGELINQLFKVEPGIIGYLPYNHSRIATGEGGGLIGEPTEVGLIPMSSEGYWSGGIYEQRPEDIHRTLAQDGTVTLIERPQGPPLQEASVYWPRGTRWVSAEPKPAPYSDIESTIEYALARWDAT